MFDKSHLIKLQNEIKKIHLDAYLIFTSDPHDSEYVADHFLALRKYFCPFTGSAGQVLILQNEAYLFADGRYWIQAENQLKDSGISLIKVGDKNVPSLPEFILQKGLKKVGVDFKLLTENQYKKIKNEGVNLVELDVTNLIENVPSIGDKPLFELDPSLVTLSRAQKINEIYKSLEKVGAKSTLITTLDDIAYILNLRGFDIPNNPVFYSYLYLSKEYGNYLFIDKNKVKLNLNDVNLMSYDEIDRFLIEHKDISTYVDPSRTNAHLYTILGHPINGKNFSYLAKAVKGEKEIQNTKEIQELDGVALLKFGKYLKDNLSKNLTEYDYSEKLKEFRLSNPRCFDLSFGTIAAVGSNAAQMHYAPTKSVTSCVTSNDIQLLVDSGGQYFGGTTDTTRTFLIGTPSEEYKRDYTLTLKALINLSKTIFLKGSDGHTIDITARQFFWNLGMDYKCGTGHGVGYMLNVHEGPNGFRYRSVPERDDQGMLVPGMITTIEPGVYKENKYGIRIENNLLCVKAFETSDGEFYKFETITYVPIDLRAVDKDLLTKEEIDWINNYHKMVYEKLAPYVNNDKELLEYLKEETKAI